MLPNKVDKSFPEVAQKVTTEVETLKSVVAKVAQKVTNIWATFVRKFVTKNFQILPNLVTMIWFNYW